MKELIRKVFEGKVIPKIEVDEEKGTETCIYTNFENGDFSAIEEEAGMDLLENNIDVNGHKIYVVFYHKKFLEQGNLGFLSVITDDFLIVIGEESNEEDKIIRTFVCYHPWENIILDFEEDEDLEKDIPKIIEIEQDYGVKKWLRDSNSKAIVSYPTGYTPWEKDILVTGEQINLPITEEVRMGWKIPVREDLEYPLKTLDFRIYEPLKERVVEKEVEVGSIENIYSLHWACYYYEANEEEFCEPEEVNLHLNYFANYEGIADRLVELLTLMREE